MGQFVDFIAGMRAQIAAVWPETLPKNGGGGVWEDTTIRFIAFKRITTPIAVIAIPPMPTGEWGMDNLVYEGTINVHYIMDTSEPGVIESAAFKPVVNKLEALTEHLMYNPLPVGQVIEAYSPDWSTASEANQLFIEKNMLFFSASAGYHVAIGRNYLSL